MGDVLCSNFSQKAKDCIASEAPQSPLQIISRLCVAGRPHSPLHSCTLEKSLIKYSIINTASIGTKVLSWGDDQYILVTVTLSEILKAKQKLGRTFNSDKLGGIAFTKISKLTMCSAQEEPQAIVAASTGQHRHCTCSVLKIL